MFLKRNAMPRRAIRYITEQYIHNLHPTLNDPICIRIVSCTKHSKCSSTLIQPYNIPFETNIAKEKHTKHFGSLVDLNLFAYWGYLTSITILLTSNLNNYRPLQPELELSDGNNCTMSLIPILQESIRQEMTFKGKEIARIYLKFW